MTLESERTLEEVVAIAVEIEALALSKTTAFSYADLRPALVLLVEHGVSIDGARRIVQEAPAYGFSPIGMAGLVIDAARRGVDWHKPVRQRELRRIVDANHDA